jgi:hypothetical protein
MIGQFSCGHMFAFTSMVGPAISKQILTEKLALVSYLYDRNYC